MIGLNVYVFEVELRWPRNKELHLCCDRRSDVRYLPKNRNLMHARMLVAAQSERMLRPRLGNLGQNMGITFFMKMWSDVNPTDCIDFDCIPLFLFLWGGEKQTIFANLDF